MASLVLLTRAGAMVLVAPARAVEVLGVPCDPAVMVALGAPVVVGELPTLHERAFAFALAFALALALSAFIRNLSERCHASTRRPPQILCFFLGGLLLISSFTSPFPGGLLHESSWEERSGCQ